VFFISLFIICPRIGDEELGIYIKANCEKWRNLINYWRMALPSVCFLPLAFDDSSSFSFSRSFGPWLLAGCSQRVCSRKWSHLAWRIAAGQE
jgi:hypothetical protein